MGTSFTATGHHGPMLPADPASSIQPHERSKLEALAIEEWRCGAPGCGGSLDVTTLRPSDLSCFCCFGHGGSLARCFESVRRRATRGRW